MPKLNFQKDLKDKAGINYKPLFVRYLQLEYWQDLKQIMTDQKTDLSGAIRWCIKRSLGK